MFTEVFNLLYLCYSMLDQGSICCWINTEDRDAKLLKRRKCFEKVYSTGDLRTRHNVGVNVGNVIDDDDDGIKVNRADTAIIKEGLKPKVSNKTVDDEDDDQGGIKVFRADTALVLGGGGVNTARDKGKSKDRYDDDDDDDGGISVARQDTALIVKQDTAMALKPAASSSPFLAKSTSSVDRDDQDNKDTHLDISMISASLANLSFVSSNVIKSSDYQAGEGGEEDVCLLYDQEEDDENAILLSRGDYSIQLSSTSHGLFSGTK